MLYSIVLRFYYDHIDVHLVPYHGWNGRGVENGREDNVREESGSSIDWIRSESIVLYRIGLYWSVASCILWILL